MSIRVVGMLCAFVAALSLGACSSKYRTDNHQVVETVTTGKSFYILQPADGIFGDINYAGSGRMLANELHKQLIPYSSKVVKASTIETRENAFNKAQNLQLNVLIDAQIMHWEDRATEWSGRPDRITILYQAFDVQQKDMLATSTLSASSKWATFGGDHPVDLLPVPTSQFVKSLFGKSLEPAPN
ncbi:DUF4823 domain-containing protein [Thalassospira australica]|uniref:DUF4823 domain-containing protein n=1 Tax=Thalassospira australica TaxID=1528106 RepID=UPI00068DDA68|nr:DUF4823 domain-containing protein [Thalassospira australica]